MMVETYKVKSINAARVQTLTFGSKTFESALLKSPIKEEMFVTKTGLTSDEQTPEHHGGTEKALCLYPYDHHHFWRDWMKVKEGESMFGENLTTEGLLERETCIGDQFQFGEAVIQVTEPRQPCFKIAAKYDKPELIVRMRDSGYTGFYFRVLKEGTVKPGDDLKLIQRDPAGVTVQHVNDLLFAKKPTKEQYEMVLSAQALSKTLRPKLEKKLSELH
ncbi:MOSC domain-containing protein [Jeotgalibacillus sp. R-1-5s-1]|nr:MOSC domain-containing protein [Jeotgalibacillus sp. R-1-5s-1]